MKIALALPLALSLAACDLKREREVVVSTHVSPRAAEPEQAVEEVLEFPAPVWRYRLKEQPDGSREAVAVQEPGGKEEALPQDLWCPHGAVIELKRDAGGKVVGAESRAEPVKLEIRKRSGGESRSLADSVTLGNSFSCGSIRNPQSEVPSVDFPVLPAFVLAPAWGQPPLVILRWKPSDQQTDFAVMERVPMKNGHGTDLRLTDLGPWQLEHLQFQRMERPGKGLENCVLFTFQAGEGSQVCVVRVEIGEKGARLRPRTADDAAILRHFLGRATPAEKAVVEKILAE